MQKYTLASHPLTADQETWLRASAAQPELPPQNLRLKLRRELAPDFSPTDIDPRLYTSDQITPLGLWRVEPRHPRLLAVDRTIREVQRRLEVDPPPTRITAKELAEAIGEGPEVMGRALHDMGSLGSFFSTSTGSSLSPNIWTEITLEGPRAYEDYLRYVNLEQLLERLYKSRGSALENAISYQTLHPGIFGDPQPAGNTALAAERQATAFVIMAMSPDLPELTDTYKAIQRACERVGLHAVRIDDIEHGETITDRVVAEIAACAYLIADLTHERPNVYYEIGYAHGLGKTPVLIRKRNTRLHFDLSVHKAPEYTTHTDLEEQLEKRLKALMDNSTR